MPRRHRRCTPGAGGIIGRSEAITVESVVNKSVKTTVVVLLGAAFAALLGWGVWSRLPGAQADAADQRRPVAVEVAPIERGPIEQRRTFSGTLEALASFDVAPKVGGRIESISVDIGDPVERGQIIAELDNDEYQQAVALAEADLAVAKANLAEAESRAQIAQREWDRAAALSERGIASESQLDTVRGDHQTATASQQVAQAQVSRAEANLATARIRLGYTTVNAAWVEGDDQRIVAERYVDPGDTISANTPLVSILEIDPIVGVITVTENDYGKMRIGQPAALATDAFPGRTFEAKVNRIAPMFRQASRQARVELLTANDEDALKPGMFIRATIVLDKADDAVIVPESAITRRNNGEGVFVVSPDGRSVSWTPGRLGIRDGGRVQLLDAEIEGRVVTLGQQLLDDGSRITIPDTRAMPTHGEAGP